MKEATCSTKAIGHTLRSVGDHTNIRNISMEQARIKLSTLLVAAFPYLRRYLCAHRCWASYMHRAVVEIRLDTFHVLTVKGRIKLWNRRVRIVRCSVPRQRNARHSFMIQKTFSLRRIAHFKQALCGKSS